MEAQDEFSLKAQMVHEAKFFVCLMVLFVVFGVSVVIAGSSVITDCGPSKVIAMVGK